MNETCTMLVSQCSQTAFIPLIPVRYKVIDLKQQVLSDFLYISNAEIDLISQSVHYFNYTFPNVDPPPGHMIPLLI